NRSGHGSRRRAPDIGAFSSLALVLCGIITSLMAPFLFPLILAVVG
ncbi:hypothetical protein VS821_23970, partial [Klebsiella pneumoniae]|nr:hypothetical protein [Klebsiella pneumoniae]